MIAYHYTTTYTGDPALKNDYRGRLHVTEPYLLALDHGRDTFATMLLYGMYRDRLLQSEKKGWLEYAKEPTEALFEYVRRREFPEGSVSRLGCVFYIDNLNRARQVARDDWGDDAPELKFLEVRLDDGRTVCYDQAFYNRSYDLISNYRSPADLEAAMDCARRYFAGERSGEPVLELLSDGEHRVLRVIDPDRTE